MSSKVDLKAEIKHATVTGSTRVHMFCFLYHCALSEHIVAEKNCISS